ncbi:hypothetical protein QWZ13_16750 [Reinekea marina]|uniref:AsmA-like protein n=1 Tax=Reinekea marina TaxID=1310421 RepID=A0ABV7WPZ8_9GAMM|nr:hypothetical protein [Reinekea marina]MDN3650557.1 hypothetical protein [Reinekea marina]
MSVITSRRLLISLASAIALLGLMSVFNLWRFDHAQWLKQQLTFIDHEQTPLTSPSTTNRFGSKLTWQNLELTLSQSHYFEAEVITLELNLVSILLGRPTIESISLQTPYFETHPESINAAVLRALLDLNAKKISIANSTAVFDDTEVHGLNIEMVKNGSLGDYSMQTSGHIRNASLDVGFNYSAMLSLAKDDTVIFRKNNLTSQTFFQQGSVQWVGKVKQAKLSTDNSLTLEFASWSSQWNQNRFTHLPELFDFSGGLEFGSWQNGEVNLRLLDAAVAFRDTQNIARTYALQSTEASASEQTITGQLSVSILAEQPQQVADPLDWQSYNFVMTGQINDNKPLISWEKPEFRLATINGEGQRSSHNITLKELSLNAEGKLWQLKDGDWNEYLDEQNTAGYGFGRLTLQWPTLKVIEGPTVTNRLQKPLNLLSNDMETINALHRLLVQ